MLSAMGLLLVPVELSGGAIAVGSDVGASDIGVALSNVKLLSTLGILVVTIVSAWPLEFVARAKETKISENRMVEK